MSSIEFSSESEKLTFELNATGVAAVKSEFVELQAELSKLNVLLYSSLELLKRSGLDEDAARAIAQVQKLIVELNMMIQTILTFSTLSAASPVGWLLFGVSFVGMAISLTDFAGSVM